jgi:hypothetical protein
MTATRARNPIGIFTTKRAKFLAQKYNLDLLNKNCYAVLSNKFVTYSDVLFIVDNLWLNHFIHNAPEPITTTLEEYNHIYSKIKNQLPFYF